MIFFLTVIWLVFCEDPETPLMPPQFTMPFEFTMESSAATLSWDSKFYYDSVNVMSRLDYAKGQADGTCMSVQPTITDECSLIQTGDWRYVIWPTHSKCCKCCNTSSGCGILKQDWIVDGKYIGDETISGVTCQGWEKQGFGANYYYLKPTQPYGIPCAIVMDYTDSLGFKETYTYNQDEYQDSVDPSVFDLPSYCDSAARCSGSLCNGG